MSCSKNTILKWFLVGVCVVLVHYLNLQRDYPAIGGEIFLPLYPFLLWELVVGVKEILKGGENE